MKIQCPGCAKTLAVADEFAGRRVKCPGCQHIIQVPSAMAVAPGPAPKPMPVPAAASGPPPAAKKPASSTAPDAVQKTATPPKPARRSCPECGESLAAGASECPECGWTSDQPAIKTSRPASRRAAPADDGEGGCYIFIRNDEVDLNRAIEKRMKKLIETERLDIQIMGEDELPPDRLGPDDLVISGMVERCDYGSRFLRYWLTFIAMFGPGSCRLEVTAEVETAEGEKRLKSRVRQWIGFFGGSGPGLMKRNVQMVAKTIATGAARHATGNRFLNAHAYSCAYWSLGLGVVSLLPFAGIPFGLIGLVLGLVALMTISRRKLPRGKVVAIIGLVLPFIGFLVSAGVIVLAMQK